MSIENKCESKSDKPEIKRSSLQKLYSPTIRLTISLCEPDEELCSVFNYLSLISEEKRNRRREKEKIGDDQVDDSEEVDSEVKKLAAHFEEKYGNGSSKKKKKKKAPTFYNYSELASGYDENDSFIDNSEAFDEALPDQMETFHGGYYVNCGQLEFKRIETDENSEVEELRTAKKKPALLQSDDSNDDDNSSKSESNDSDSESEAAVNESKKLPEENDQKSVDLGTMKNTVILSKVSDKWTCEMAKPNDTVPLTNGDLARKKKKKYKKRHLPDDTDSRPKKKARTVKHLLEEKRTVENDENANGYMGKNVDNYHNSINDVIESVVNAARNHSDDSRDSASSSETKSLDSRTSNETEKENHMVEEIEVTELVANDGPVLNITKEVIKLPDNLPSDVLGLVTQLKTVAVNSESGARTFFNCPVNSKLMCKLEKKTRSLTSSCRMGVYTYLASFLPCSKETLMKRSRKLLVEEEEKKITDLLNKLQSAIDKVIPSLMENERTLEENAFKSNEFEEKNQRITAKTFVWTDEMRNYVHELAMCHLRCLHLLKPKKESSDEPLKKFMETKVKPLWPLGWMDTPTILAEARISSVPSNSKKAPRTSNAASGTTASAKKTQPPVPTSNILSPPSVSVSSTPYNLLTNSLALQSLSMQYTQPADSVYSAAAAVAAAAASAVTTTTTVTSNIPYRSDLSLHSTAGATASSPTIPFSMNVLSRIAATANHNHHHHHHHQSFPITSTTNTNSSAAAAHHHHSYSKSVVNPNTKKQTTPASSSLSTAAPQRVSTSAVSSVAGPSFPAESRKSGEHSGSKVNDMFKIDSLIAKTKKEHHHQLNHVSQYNKHYSHKVEKKKIASEKRDDTSYVSSKSPVSLIPNASNVYSSNCKNSNNQNGKNHCSNTGNNSNGGHTSGSQKSIGTAGGNASGTNRGGGGNRRPGNANCNGVKVCSAEPAAGSTTADLVLDLSPNKITKADQKSDVASARRDHHPSKNNNKINISNANNANVNSNSNNNKNDTSALHLASANVTAKDHSYWSSVKEDVDVKDDPIFVSSISSSDKLKNKNGMSRPVHVSRKQRILQESVKAVNSEPMNSVCKDANARLHSALPNHIKTETSVLNIMPPKSLEERKRRSSPAIREEKRLAMLDIKQVIRKNKTASDVFDNIVQVLQTEPNSTCLNRSASFNSYFCPSNGKRPETKAAGKKRLRVRMKSTEDKKRSAPSLIREEKRISLPKEIELKETTTATDILSKIINDTLQERTSLHRPFVNSTFESLEKKLVRDAREKESQKSCETEMRLLQSRKESATALAEKTSTNAERKSANFSERSASHASSSDDLAASLARSAAAGHRLDRIPVVRLERDSRIGKDKFSAGGCEATEIKLHLAVKESQLQAAAADKGPGQAIAERGKMSTAAGGAAATDRGSGGQMAEDVIKDLLVLNKFVGHSIPRRYDQLDAAYMFNSNANELNGSNNEMLNQSSLSSSSKLRNTNAFQEEFRKHIFKTDPGNS